MASTPPPTSSLLLLLLLLATAQPLAAVDTFTYVNTGELGPYITEYNADYRTLPVFASPFQLCFFNTSPDAFSLGLRMATRRSESTFRWVWEANSGRPVRDNATFSLLADGNLVLANADHQVVWSTGTANKGVAGLRLLPTGNLVLYDSKGRFLWQSFDHPADTLLVGQSLRVGGPRELVSRGGKYRLRMESGGLAMYFGSVAAGSEHKLTPYYNYSDGTLSFPASTRLVTLECQPETEEGYAYELRLAVEGSGTIILARPKYNATLSFLKLQPDGNLVAYTYYDPVDYRAWERTFAFFDDDIGRASGCELPSKCGALGVCEDEMCVACPTAKGLAGWSKSCAPPAAGKCGSGKGGRGDYYKVVGVENYLTRYGVGDGIAKVEECRRRCSLDCKCLGFMFWEKESRCWLAPVVGTLGKVDNSSHVAYVKYFD